MKQEIAVKWYRQARRDLEMAEKNLQIGGYDVAASLCQQSVEKLLKSILIFEKGTAPKTHYLDELADILGIEGELRTDILDFSADYMFARYPDVSDQIPFEEYTQDVATEKVDRCKRVFLECSNRTESLKRMENEP